MGETSWANSWGINVGLKFQTSVAGAFGWRVGIETGMEVNYNGLTAGNVGKAETILVNDETTFVVPPGKMMLVRFMVDQDDEATVPFTATIRRQTESGEQVFQESGVWH